MIRNTYDIAVNGRTLRDFEFIVGPMIGVSMPHSPRQPEEFVLGSFCGGGTPIVAPRDIEVSQYIEDIARIRRRMEDRCFGANVLGMLQMAPDFIKEFSKLGDDGPEFLDLSAIELDFDTILPLLKDVRVPISMGIYQPSSVLTFQKLLLRKEYSFLIDRLRSGALRLSLPRNKGGGHLPILLRKHEKLNWLDNLIREVMDLGEAIDTPIPFIVEKGMMTVDDFVDTIIEYSQYPGFAGLRFASNLLLTKESGLAPASKELLAKVVREQRRDMIIPIRSFIANTKFNKGMNVRGGLVIYVVGTRIAKMIHEIQCGGRDFPQFSRTYNPAVLVHQATSIERRVCHLCSNECPLEYCEVKGSYDAVCPDSDVDDALIIVSPTILDIDQSYIDAPVGSVVQDLIKQTLSRIHDKDSERQRADNESMEVDVRSS